MPATLTKVSTNGKHKERSINWRKLECMIAKINLCKNFNFLWSVVRDDGKWDEEIRRGIGIGKRYLPETVVFRVFEIKKIYMEDKLIGK